MLYVLLMYLAASRDYSREYMCNPLLSIVEVWTELGSVVFSFTLDRFPCKNSGVWFIFLLHEFIYLLMLVSIAYLILHKEIVEKLWCLLEYCEFTLTNNLYFIIVNEAITILHLHCCSKASPIEIQIHKKLFSTKEVNTGMDDRKRKAESSGERNLESSLISVAKLQSL